MKISLKNLSQTLLNIYIISIYLFAGTVTTLRLSHLAFIAFAIVSLFYVISNKIKISNILLLLSGFVLYSAISLFWASSSGAGFGMVLTLAQLLLLSFLAYNIADENLIRKIPYFFAYAGILMFIYSMIVYTPNGIIQSVISGKRIGDKIAQINDFGMQAAIASIACIFIAIYYEKRRYLLFVPFIVILVLASGSKKALIILMVGTIITYVLKYGLSFRFLVFMSGLFIVGILALQLPYFSSISKRFSVMIQTFLGNDSVDGSTSERMNMISIGLRLFSGKPIFGYGTANYAINAAPFLGRPVYSHNNFIELLVNGGVFGFLLFYFSYFIFFIKSISLKKYTFIFIYLFIMILLDIGQVSYYSKILFIMMGLAGYHSIDKFAELRHINVQNV